MEISMSREKMRPLCGTGNMIIRAARRVCRAGRLRAESRLSREVRRRLTRRVLCVRALYKAKSFAWPEQE
jgi:hypothetical protein